MHWSLRSMPHGTQWRAVDGVGAEWSESVKCTVPDAVVLKQDEKKTLPFKSGFDWPGFDLTFSGWWWWWDLKVSRVVAGFKRRGFWSAADVWYAVGG